MPFWINLAACPAQIHCLLHWFPDSFQIQQRVPRLITLGWCWVESSDFRKYLTSAVSVWTSLEGTLIWEFCCTQNPTISWVASLLVAKRNYAGHLAQGISADGDLIMLLAALLVLKGCAALLAVWSLAWLHSQIRGESVGGLLCVCMWEHSCKFWFLCMQLAVPFF